MALGLMGLLTTSCSQYELVNSQVYNNADLAAYKSFRIVTPEQGKLPPGMQMVTYYNIAAAIREQMVERGYTEDPNSPLLINIGLTVKQEIATEPALPPGGAPVPPPPPYAPGYGPGYGPYGGYYPYFMWPRYNYWNSYYQNAQLITGIYHEGVLTMDMVNMQEKLPLYSASVATILNSGEDMAQFRNLQGIAQAVQTLFSKFPVPLLPQYKK